jgi:hypothetical protein
MTKPKSTKSRTVTGAPSDAGNTSSGDNLAPARPWTDEEMATAKPIPLPTVDAIPAVGQAGVPHAGKGETKPAGRPEKTSR